MDIEMLRMFLQAAESKSFSKCAEEFHVNRVAVKRQMDMLEREVGAVLFSRNTKGVQLTASGESFFKDIRPILASLDTAIREARSRSVKKLLYYGVYSEAPVPDLSSILSTYAQMRPSMKVELVSMPADMLLPCLLEKKIDICEGAIPPGENSDGFDFHPISSHHFVCILKKNHPFAHKSSLSLQDLKRQSIATRMQTYRGLVDALRENSIECLDMPIAEAGFSGIVHFINLNNIFITLDFMAYLFTEFNNFISIPLDLKDERGLQISGLFTRKKPPAHILDFVESVRRARCL